MKEKQKIYGETGFAFRYALTEGQGIDIGVGLHLVSELKMTRNKFAIVSESFFII